MRFFRVAFCFAIATASLHIPHYDANLHAWKYSTDLGGGGYQEARACPALAPTVLFALIALGAIIAVAIKTPSDHKHAHEHTH